MPDSLSVIIPAYNEELNLTAVYNDIKNRADKLDIDYEIIIVDDGSRDNTPAIAGELKRTDNKTKVVTHASNQGSGMAIRSGVAAAEKDLIIYVPADGQFEINEIQNYGFPYTINAKILDIGRFDFSVYSKKGVVRKDKMNDHLSEIRTKLNMFNLNGINWEG